MTEGLMDSLRIKKRVKEIESRHFRFTSLHKTIKATGVETRSWVADLQQPETRVPQHHQDHWSHTRATGISWLRIITPSL